MKDDGFGDDFFGGDDTLEADHHTHDPGDHHHDAEPGPGSIDEHVIPDSVYSDPTHMEPAYPGSERFPSGDPMEYGTPDQDVYDVPLGQDAEMSLTGNDDAASWDEQTTPFTCGVMSTRSIIQSLTGQEFSEAQLVYDATANGWLTDGGMTLDGVANLLEFHGVPCEMHMDGNINELISELQQGHRAVVAVDSGEIWKTDSILSDFTDGADHAIAVSDVRMNAEEIPVVVVNDSGVPDGAGKEYPLEDFMDAWSNSSFSYVVTK